MYGPQKNRKKGNVIDEMWRCVMPGGSIVITSSTPVQIWESLSYAKFLPEAYQRYVRCLPEKEWFEKYMHDLGMEVVE